MHTCDSNSRLKVVYECKNRAIENSSGLRGVLHKHLCVCVCVCILFLHVSNTPVTPQVARRLAEKTLRPDELSRERMLTESVCYILICMHTHMHTCMQAYTQAYMQAYMHAYMHTYVHTYMHTCIHAYVHTCMHRCNVTHHLVTLQCQTA